MELTVLGRCGAFPQAGGANSSFLLSSDKAKLILDFGDGALSRVSNFIKIEDVDAIIITHLHFDHVIDMTILQYYLQINNIEKKIKVLTAEKDSETAKLYFPQKYFDVVQIEEDKEYKFNDISIKFYEVLHSVKTFGLVAKCGKRVLGYTADSRLCSGLEKIISQSDVAVCDCAISLKSNENSVHASIPEMAELCKKYGVKLFAAHLCESEETVKIALESVLKKREYEIVKEAETYVI